jgi:dTDP-4-amino-4,6-dideoxygalactose transaminase
MTDRTIPFFNYPHLFREHDEEYSQVLAETCRRGAFIMQSDLFDFESDLAAYVGVKHAIGVADGTMGLLLSLLASPLEPGDEVLVPSHTFVASAAAIHHAGGTPVLVDCGPDHLIDIESAALAITPRTRGVMPVQLNGRIADMDGLAKLAEEHGLFVVEDACQSLGAQYKSRQAGTFGLAGAISFYPSKTLGCFGDGGAVVTNDDAVAARIRLLRDHGRAPTGEVTAWGYNARLDNLQAAVLRVKLRRYDREIARRRELAQIYSDELGGLDQLLLPPPPAAGSERFDIFQNYEIEADNRDELRAFLAERGVATIIQWGGKAIHQFTDLGFSTVPPYTERMLSRFMLLPMNTSLSDAEVHYVCKSVREFYGA